MRAAKSGVSQRVVQVPIVDLACCYYGPFDHSNQYAANCTLQFEHMLGPYNLRPGVSLCLSVKFSPTYREKRNRKWEVTKAIQKLL